MNVDLFRHWIPSLRQSKTKYVYLARSCYFCNEYRLGRNNSFRINTKLKVWKCYKCGIGGKDFNKFKYYMKIFKKKGKHPLSISFEYKVGVEEQLPF